MSEEILVSATPRETRVALLAADQVQELLIERSANPGIVGNLYLGKVARVLPGMQSAFVEIGLERAAFLHADDIRGNRRGGGAGPPRPIEKLLAEGQPLLVQVIKDPIGGKGARLSTQVALAGRLLVYLPQDPHIGISQRIEDEAGRAHLRERLRELLPPGETGGYILRTLAEGASDEELAADIAYLSNLWREIGARASAAQPPALVHRDLGLAERVLRDRVTAEVAAVRVDARETFERLAAFAAAHMPALAPRLQHYVGDRPLFELYDVEAEIEKALARRVDLKSGGSLVIDQTEAMTTIDVNTAAFVGGRSFDDTVLRTNLEAAQAIARQMRLRNLGGIIIVDFIDMGSAEHRAAVLEELRRALARDRTRVTVNGFTALGLVEITRKRTRESLAHVLCEPCPVCAGRGEVKSARTVCNEILRELAREARAWPGRQLRVLASAPVCDLLLEEESGALAALTGLLGRPVSVQVEPGYTPEQYDIVLL